MVSHYDFMKAIRLLLSCSITWRHQKLGIKLHWLYIHMSDNSFWIENLDLRHFNGRIPCWLCQYNPATCLVSKLRRLHEPRRYGFMSRVSFNVFPCFRMKGLVRSDVGKKNGKLLPTLKKGLGYLQINFRFEFWIIQFSCFSDCGLVSQEKFGSGFIMVWIWI